MSQEIEQNYYFSGEVNEILGLALGELHLCGDEVSVVSRRLREYREADYQRVGRGRLCPVLGRTFVHVGVWA